LLPIDVVFVDAPDVARAASRLIHDSQFIGGVEERHQAVIEYETFSLKPLLLVLF